MKARSLIWIKQAWWSKRFIKQRLYQSIKFVGNEKSNFTNQRNYLIIQEQRNIHIQKQPQKQGYAI
jgi:hypothetical protein